jgi:hypothetical protein
MIAARRSSRDDAGGHRVDDGRREVVFERDGRTMPSRAQ